MKAFPRILSLAFLFSTPLFAQLPPGFVHPSLNPRFTNEKSVSIQVFGSWVKMIGDSVDHSTIDPWAGVTINYGVTDRFTLAFETGFGWIRAKKEGTSSFSSTSAFPFKTNLAPFLAHGAYYLRDYEWLLMPFIEGIIGVVYWDARDLRNGTSTTFDNGVRVRSSVSPAIGIGGGLDYFLSPKFAFTTSLRGIKLFTGGRETSGLTNLGNHNGDRNSVIVELKIGAKFVLQPRLLKKGARLRTSTGRARAGNQIMYSKEDDADGDRISDFHEMYHYKTDPNNADSDRDGLKDGVELWKYRTNPNKKDTDGDGISDGKEVLVLKTNPLRRDAGTTPSSSSKRKN